MMQQFCEWKITDSFSAISGIQTWSWWYWILIKLLKVADTRFYKGWASKGMHQIPLARCTTLEPAAAQWSWAWLEVWRCYAPAFLQNPIVQCLTLPCSLHHFPLPSSTPCKFFWHEAASSFAFRELEVLRKDSGNIIENFLACGFSQWVTILVCQRKRCLFTPWWSTQNRQKLLGKAGVSL